MKASAATIDITPPPGLEFAGNIREDNIARGTHDPLLCNAVLMESGGVRVLLLAMDWLGFEKEDADWLRDRVGQVAGVDAGHVVVSATHTHSGPRVVARFGLRDRAPGEDAYLRSACQKIVERAAGLPAALEPASLWRGMLPVDGLSFNRRLRLADGSLRMNWMPVEPDEVIGTTGPVDPALTVMGLRSGGGEWLALLVNFTLHPAILVGAEWLWSADYVHYLRRTLREGLPGRPVVHFTNGAEGDVNHLNYRDPMQLDGFPEAERIGTALGRAALTALEGGEPMPDAWAARPVLYAHAPGHSRDAGTVGPAQVGPMRREGSLATPWYSRRILRPGNPALGRPARRRGKHSDDGAAHRGYGGRNAARRGLLPDRAEYQTGLSLRAHRRVGPDAGLLRLHSRPESVL